LILLINNLLNFNRWTDFTGNIIKVNTDPLATLVTNTNPQAWTSRRVEVIIYETMKVGIHIATHHILKLQAAIHINLNLTQFIILRLIIPLTHQELLQTIILIKMSQEGKTTKKTIKSMLMMPKIVHIRNIHIVI
jgi:hypothetical protein